MPGDYCIPFAFMLPPGVPSSIFYKNHNHLKKPKAKIKYTLKTILHSHHHHDNMKYKQVIIVREAPEANQFEIK